MSFDALAWAKRQTCGSPAAKLILLLLAEHTSQSGRCMPSQRLLAQESEQSRQSVSTHLAGLEKLGLIRREQRHRASGGYTTCQYRLIMQGTLDFGALPTEDEDEPPEAPVDDDETLTDMIDRAYEESGLDDGVKNPDSDGVKAGDVKDFDSGGNGEKPPNRQKDGVKNPDSAMSNGFDSHKNQFSLNQKERGAGAGAGAGATPSPNVFVREDDAALFKYLEARHCRRYPGQRSAPRKSQDGYQGWFFPKADIDEFRDRGGKVLA